MGLVLRGELRRYAQALDGEAGARVGTLAATRARLLGQLGLDRLEHDAIDLRAYLAAQNGAERTNGADQPPIHVRTERNAGGRSLSAYSQLSAWTRAHDASPRAYWRRQRGAMAVTTSSTAPRWSSSS
jgi:hypothetical protein